MADLEEIMAGRQAEPETPTSEPNRDEGGRFAEGERQQPEIAPQQQAPTEPESPERQQMVPHQALHAAREEAKGYREKFGTLESRFNDLERQNQQLVQMLRQPQQPAQPPTPQEAPDWYQDPQAAFAHNIGQAITPLQQQLMAQREGFSQMLAVEKFGADAVQAAQSELEKKMQANPHGMRHVYAGIMASPHPYGSLVNWHKEQSTLGRIGADPDAFIEAEVQRRLAEMGHQPAPQPQAAPQPAAPAQQLPSSFASARNGGPRSSPQATGPRALSEIMGR